MAVWFGGAVWCGGVVMVVVDLVCEEEEEILLGNSRVRDIILLYLTFMIGLTINLFSG